VRRAVLDSVIFVRALINPFSMWGRLVFDLTDTYLLVTSPDIVAEVQSVIIRPRLLVRYPRMADPARVALIAAVLDDAEMFAPDAVPPVCRDQKDDKFFACAVAGRADYIVSEDEDVLAVAEYEGARTIRTAAFLKLLDEAAR
jgi:putative PIN family toxin of toxin-antitoxin system